MKRIKAPDPTTIMIVINSVYPNATFKHWGSRYACYSTILERRKNEARAQASQREKDSQTYKLHQLTLLRGRRDKDTSNRHECLNLEKAFESHPVSR